MSSCAILLPDATTFCRYLENLFARKVCPLFGQSLLIRRGIVSSIESLRNLVDEYLYFVKKIYDLNPFFEPFCVEYGMLKAMFTEIQSATTFKSLGFLVYGRRHAKYGRSESVNSPFKTIQQLADTSTARYLCSMVKTEK